MRDAQNPVLAHAFLDFMLDRENALDNFGFVGYQPPITELSADRLVDDEFVPENLTNALVPEPELGTGIRRLGLSPEGEVLWQATWAEFLAG
jgi:spermidine/putrescine-binding protein